MLKRVPNAAWIALGALYFCGFAWIAWSSSNYPTKQYSAAKSGQTNQRHIEQGTVGDWLTHDAAGFFTFFLVIVGSAQAGLFVWQLRYMHNNLRDAKLLAEAAKASADAAKDQVAVTKMGIFDLERAYLACGPAGIRSDFRMVPGKAVFRPGDPLDVTLRIHVHNYGRTGAIIKKVYGEFGSPLPLGDVPVYKHGAEFLTDVSIAHGVEMTLEPFVFQAEAKTQFFWGYVEFIDIFKIKHKSRFCAIIYPATTAGGGGKYNMAGSEAWRDFD